MASQLEEALLNALRVLLERGDGQLSDMARRRLLRAMMNAMTEEECEKRRHDQEKKV